MKSLRFAPLSFIALLLFIFPQITRANEPFSPTVKIVAYEHLLNGQVINYAEGSGTIINSSGQVLTNAHVIIDDELNKPFHTFAICVSEDPHQAPTCRFTASVIRYDQKIDLALLQINTPALWGDTPSIFPYLKYNHGVEPTQGEVVSVEGFSASGGSTVNLTQGQISGFEAIGGYNYLKTDADIDAGNSGGTMLDSQGNFIGIPTYVVTYYENSGRALSIAEAEKWIDSNVGQKWNEDKLAQLKLSEITQKIHNANEKREVTLSPYPGISMDLPNGWSVDKMSDSEFIALRNDNYFGSLYTLIQPRIFSENLSSEESMALLFNYLNLDPSIKSKVIDLGGNEALHFSWQKSGESYNMIYYNYAHSNLIFIYGTFPEDEAVIQKDIDQMLQSLSFSSSKETENKEAKTILNELSYPFTLQMAEGWKVIKSLDSNYNLARAEKNSPEFQELNIDYYPMANDSAYQYLMEAEPFYGTLTSSQPITLDGFSGNLSIYENKEVSPNIKTAVVILEEAENELRFVYSAEISIFEKGFEEFKKTMLSFKSKRYDESFKSEWSFDPSGKGNYKFPSLPASKSVELSDITGHRYEQNILNLVKRGIINGNPDGTFRPEEPVNRAAALKIILQSLRANQEANGESPFVMAANFNAFPDVPKNIWYETYVAEGLEKGIIKGYPDGSFKGENTVNLAEALKMTLEAHDVTVWSGETNPWYKKYFDSAHSLNLLPSDLQDPSKLLTRAELAYIVDQLINDISS